MLKNYNVDLNSASTFSKLGPKFQIISIGNKASIAPLNNGDFVVIWQRYQQEGSDYNIYGQRYDENGNPVGLEFLIFDSNYNFQIQPSITSLANGGFVVTWESYNEDGSGYDICGKRYDANRNPVGSDFLINTSTDGSQNNPSITSLADGGFVVTWDSYDQTISSSLGIYGQLYDANGNRVGPNFLINTSTDGSQNNPSITSLANGGFVVTWDSQGESYSNGTYGQLYDANGNRIGTEFYITQSYSSNQVTTALTDGGFIVTWQGENFDGPQLRGQLYDANGNPIGTAIQLTGITSNPEETRFFNHSITSLKDGGFFATWSLGSKYNYSPNTPRGQRYDANGNRVGLEFAMGGGGESFVTTLANGELIVIWNNYAQRFGTGGQAGAIAFSETSYSIKEDGTPIAAVTLVRTDGSDGDVSVTLTPSNGTATALDDYDSSPIVVNFASDQTSKTVQIPIVNNQLKEANETINLILSNPTENVTLGNVTNTIVTIIDDDQITPSIKIGPEFQISTDINYYSNSSSVVSLTDGGFVIFESSYKRDLGSNIYGQRYDANSNPIGTKSLIITDPYYVSSYSIASFAGGGFVVIWKSTSGAFSVDYYGQCYDADSNPIGTKFPLSVSLPFLTIDYSVAPLGDGGFVVTSSQTNRYLPISTVGQRYDVNNNPIGSGFIIDSDGSSDSSVTSLGNGEYVIIWGTYTEDDLGYNILGQHYDVNFNPIGSEFQINTYTDNRQSNPSVASLVDGSFVVTWQSNGQDGSGTGIYGQRYDVNANRIGSEFQINTYTVGNQDLPSVTSLADEGFIVTWTSDDQDGSGTGIYGQHYDVNANQIGSEFRINTNINNSQKNSSSVALNDGRFVAIWETIDNQQVLGVSGQIFGQVPSYGVFNLNQLTRSGFIDGLSFNPVEIGSLPVASLYDETFYLNQNPDVTAAVNSGIVSNGYTHFVNSGQFEGRDPSILYDETYYLTHNPDVANAVTTRIISSGFQHYALYGQQEGRNPSTVFNEFAYRNANPDVADVINNGGFRSGFEHYLESGQAEGRSPLNFLYNEAYYLGQNLDVANAVALSDFQDGFEHYINYGQTEKRNPSSLFNESDYLALNSDIADAVNAGLITSGFKHYILYGRIEGRDI